jgi:hypothetical protein
MANMNITKPTEQATMATMKGWFRSGFEIYNFVSYLRKPSSFSNVRSVGGFRVKPFQIISLWKYAYKRDEEVIIFEEVQLDRMQFK